MRIGLRLPTRAGRDLLERSLDPFARVRVLQLDAVVRRTGGFGAAQRPDGLYPLPDDLLYADAPRRLYEAGATPAYVMAHMGHTDASLALEVYAKVMERKRDTGERMDALVKGADWAQTAPRRSTLSPSRRTNSAGAGLS